MSDVLARIVERKRREVATRLADGPVAAVPTSRSLRAALARPGARFVMEVKRASPSGHRARVGLTEAVAAYAPVADAISVLTDGPDFGGSIDDLRRVRAQFDGPVLAKDFIVDPAQVSEARAAGADAVLAMMSVLEDTCAARVIGEARRFRMDVIVEVHDEVELRRALRLGADIVGINNRDLKSLTTDLAVTERLAPMIPPDVLVISESGVSCRVDVERLRVHADAFLVGSALMDSENIVEAARALLFGRVKLCGLTSEADVRLAAQAGATHAGFIMVPESSRAVTPADIAPLAALARASGLKTVGVFRDAEIGLVAKTAEALQLDAIQLHGSEDPQHYLRRLPESSEIWAVCGVGSTAAPPREGANRSLFDTIRHHASGGTGKAFDWSLIEGRADLSSGFLAGGIGPGNAAQATMVGVYGLDVGSSVEAAPGQKDRVKVEALFAALRPTARGES